MPSVTRYPRKMAKRTDRLTDAVLKKIEALRVQHGSPGQPMKQKTLARRSGQTYARVHKFLSGQMPYPPLDFLDALLQSFGTNLARVLSGEMDTPAQRPILREDVQQVADMLDDGSPELVEAARNWIALFLRGQATTESTGRTNQAPESEKVKVTDEGRAKRGARKG
jgi:transcriptional regulator with XRE-family HTH domain